MDINEIKNDKELTRKLRGIHKSLLNAIEDDYDLDKFSYRENEVKIMFSHNAINERSASNRLRKVKALVELSQNWDAFQIVYKDDSILKKIGAEFLQGKLEFNAEILETIKDFPQKKVPLYYFKKGEKIDLENIDPNDYINIKNKILPSIESEAQDYLEQKADVSNAIKAIMSAKKTMIIKKEDLNDDHAAKVIPGIKLKSEYGQELFDILEKVKKGNFLVQQDSNIMIVEVPITATEKKNSETVSEPTILIKMNLDNPQDYVIEAGSLAKLNLKINDKLESIRQRAFSSPSAGNGLSCS